jgi:uncharacterized membrane protein YGL010W
MSAEVEESRRIDRLLDEFRENHRNILNRLLHFIAMPLLVWSILAFLASLPLNHVLDAIPFLTWASLLAVLAVLCCLALSWPLAAGMAVYLVMCFTAIAAYHAWGSVPLWQFAITVFLIAWLLLFIGHKLEGRRATLGKRAQFLLIGPLWLLAELFGLFRVRY